MYQEDVQQHASIQHIIYIYMMQPCNVGIKHSHSAATGSKGINKPLQHTSPTPHSALRLASLVHEDGSGRRRGLPDSRRVRRGLASPHPGVAKWRSEADGLEALCTAK